MKRTIGISLLIAAMLCGVTGVKAQSKNYNKEQKKIFWDAESYYVYGDYLTAKNLYKKIEGVDPYFTEVQFKLGDSYYKLEAYDSAKYHLKKGRFFNADGIFYLAKIYLYEGNLEKAEETLEEYLVDRDARRTAVKEQDIERIKGNIKTAAKYLQVPEVVNIINLGEDINSKDDEYVPLISADERMLVYTSRRITENNKMDPTGRPFEDVYLSERASGNDKWGKAKPIEGEINTPKHDACVGLSPDGETMFIYRSNENLIGGDLYESVKMDGKWTVPVRMSDNINNENTIEPSASLSLDGRTFYFSSNRPGGYGGFDIYRVVKLPNGEWSLAKNLGPSINTPFDDDAPFIHPDGKTLYFSSEGHENMGGYDVFKSQLLGDTTWTKAVNLGAPTNTTKDDIYFTISANEQHGYYSSDKKGGFGGHDIYMIDYLEKSLRQSVIRAYVKEASLALPLEANISLIEMETGDLAGVYLSNPLSGKFIFLVNPNVEYEIIIEATGYEEYSEIIQFSVEELMGEQSKEFKIKPIGE
jgi:YHS domain-containing protein